MDQDYMPQNIGNDIDAEIVDGGATVAAVAEHPAIQPDLIHLVDDMVTLGQLGEGGPVLHVSKKRNSFNVAVSPNTEHHNTNAEKVLRAMLSSQQDVANLDYYRFGRKAEPGEVQILGAPNIDNFTMIVPSVVKKPSNGKWGEQSDAGEQKAAINQLFDNLQKDGAIDIGNTVRDGTFVCDPVEHKIKFKMAGAAKGNMQKYIVKTAGYALRQTFKMMKALQGAEVHCPNLKAVWTIRLNDMDLKVDYAGTLVVRTAVSALRAAKYDAEWAPERGLVVMQTPYGESYLYNRFKRCMEAGSVKGNDIGCGLHEVVNAVPRDEYDVFQKKIVHDHGWTRAEHRLRFLKWQGEYWQENEAATMHLKTFGALDSFTAKLAAASEWSTGLNITSLNEQLRSYDEALAGNKGEPCFPGVTHGGGMDAPSHVMAVFFPSVQRVRRARGGADLAARTKEGEVEPRVDRHLPYLSAPVVAPTVATTEDPAVAPTGNRTKKCDFMSTVQFAYGYSQNTATGKIQGGWGRANAYSEGDGGFGAMHDALVTHTPNLPILLAVCIKGGFEDRYCKLVNPVQLIIRITKCAAENDPQTTFTENQRSRAFSATHFNDANFGRQASPLVMPATHPQASR